MKKGILSNFGISNELRMRQLIKGDVLNGKLSFILNQLRNIAGDSCKDEVLRTIFMEHLPEEHRVILAPCTVQNLTELATMADKISEQVQTVQPRGNQTLANVAAVSTTANTEARLDAIVAELAEIKQKFERPYQNRRSRFRSQSRNRRFRSNSREKENEKCWYHKKFGKDARKCGENGCTMKLHTAAGN